MNLSEKLTVFFVLIAVGFFGLNMAHSKISGKSAKASINSSQIQSIN